MAAVSKDAPTKSFFSSPSHTLKKLVSAFPKVQKHSFHSSGRLQEGNVCQHPEQALTIDCLQEEEDGEEKDYEDHVSEELDDDDANDSFSSGALRISPSLAAEEDGVDIDSNVDDDTEYVSSEGEYPRPRIREDLLPHDFSAWQKSPSIAPYPHSEASSTSREAEAFSEVFSSSTSQDRRSSQGKCASQSSSAQFSSRPKFYSNSCHMERDSRIEPHRNPSPVFTSAADLHLHRICQALPDLKLDIGLSGARRYGGSAGLKGLPEDCGILLNRGCEGSRRNSVDGSCRQGRKVPDLVAGGQAQEIVDMMPFIEAYRVHQEDGQQGGGNFQHHASMVYTRAPSREALVKKVANSMNTRRVFRNVRKVKKKGNATWEEQENLPKQAKADVLSRSPRIISYENSVDIAKLQSQVEELQRKLVDREDLQQGGEESKEENSHLLLFTRRMEELQRKVIERDQMLKFAKEDITQKEEEIQGLKGRLQDTEETCAELRTRNAKREEEVTVLRCEVAALRWQIAVDTEKRSEVETSVDVNDSWGRSDLSKQEEELEVCEMEAVRKMYRAAIVVARRVPIEECLALVDVLRIQLQCILRIPSLQLC